MLFSRNSLRAFQAAVLGTLLFAAVTVAQAQFDIIRKRIPGARDWSAPEGRRLVESLLRESAS